MTPARALRETFRRHPRLRLGALLSAPMLWLVVAYLGALAGLQSPSIMGGPARIAACEAQHAAYFTTLLGGKTFKSSFPDALTIDQVSDALDAYTA